MKPLLLDILACPICKYYPLKLDILKWETSERRFSKLLEAYHKKDIEFLKKATKIRRGKERIDDGVIITQNDQLIIRDEMVRNKSNIIDYLKEVEPKFENFEVMEDHTDETYSSCLKLIKSEVIQHILNIKTKVIHQKINETPLEAQRQILDDILSDIYLLNWFFQFSEIEEGVIFCPKCSRYFPIIETIPQMLPDDLREKENDIKFLKNWKSILSKKIIESGKPFNLRTERG